MNLGIPTVQRGRALQILVSWTPGGYWAAWLPYRILHRHHPGGAAVLATLRPRFSLLELNPLRALEQGRWDPEAAISVDI